MDVLALRVLLSGGFAICRRPTPGAEDERTRCASTFVGRLHAWSKTDASGGRMDVRQSCTSVGRLRNLSKTDTSGGRMNVLALRVRLSGGRAALGTTSYSVPRAQPFSAKRNAGPRTCEDRRFFLQRMVGARGFEPPTPTTPLWCATRLRYAPTVCFVSTLLGFSSRFVPCSNRHWGTTSRRQ